jgi:hypothetical protein
MMEEGDTGDTAEQEKAELEAEGSEVLPSMVALSPIPLIWPVILTL